MKLGYTLQQLEGWRGQYDRVLRWHKRATAAANGDPSPGEIDFLLAFFENCFQLRDWLHATSTIDQKSLDDLIHSTPQLRICRDLANGFKHHTIKHPSIDAQLAVVNEYVPKGWPSTRAYPNGKWTVLVENEKYGSYQVGLVDLADQCVTIWQEFFAFQGFAVGPPLHRGM